jgi:hypothetical protein
VDKEERRKREEREMEEKGHRGTSNELVGDFIN